MLCLLPGISFPGVFPGLLSSLSMGVLNVISSGSLVKVTPLEMAPSPRALPFSAHLLNNLLGTYCVSGIVLGQGLLYF